MMRLFLLLPVLLASACDKPSAEERAQQDARDVAMVEAAQKVQPPVRALGPQPIVAADMDRYGLRGPGCRFVAAGGRDPILLADGVRGLMKVGDHIVVLAADSGSRALPEGAHEKYSGRGHWIQLTRAPDRLTVRDRYERVVYSATGTLACTG